MRKVWSKTSVTRCKATQRPLVDQPLESPIIVLIENYAAVCQEVGTSGTSEESIPETTKLTPPAATRETATATRIDGSEAEGSRNPAIRVVPFQTLPQTAQEELGKDLFDDPLHSIENVKKLADYMQWSFKYTKVRFLLLSLLT